MVRQFLDASAAAIGHRLGGRGARLGQFKTRRLAPRLSTGGGRAKRLQVHGIVAAIQYTCIIAQL